MATMASAVSGMRAVCDKEGIDPGQCPEHHTPHFHQRRRRSRGSRSKDWGHNRTGQDACPGRRDRLPTDVPTQHQTVFAPVILPRAKLSPGARPHRDGESKFQADLKHLAREIDLALGGLVVAAVDDVDRRTAQGPAQQSGGILLDLDHILPSLGQPPGICPMLSNDTKIPAIPLLPHE